MKMLSRARENIAGLFPGYFALVMATGIVSTACHLQGYHVISSLLFIINLVAYGVLLVLFLLRLLFYFTNFRRDLCSHAKGAGFLTFVAGTNILGNQLAQVHHNYFVALALWIAGLAAWAMLIYAFFISITLSKSKPTLEEGMSGNLLLMVVSTQSLAILGCSLYPYMATSWPSLGFVCGCFFLLGMFFYFVLITLNIYRLSYYPLKADEFKPNYWIDMGAAAITALSGSALLPVLAQNATLVGLVPPVRLLCLLFWVVATWWIPVIVIIEGWQIRRRPVRYFPGYWSLVFPLGMYTVTCWQLADVFAQSFLRNLSEGFIFVALAAWIVTFAGMCGREYRRAAYPKASAGGEGNVQ